MGYIPKTGEDFLRSLWADEALRNHPNLLRVGDRLVIMTYGTHRMAQNP